MLALGNLVTSFLVRSRPVLAPCYLACVLLPLLSPWPIVPPPFLLSPLPSRSSSRALYSDSLLLATLTFSRFQALAHAATFDASWRFMRTDLQDPEFLIRVYSAKTEATDLVLATFVSAPRVLPLVGTLTLNDQFFALTQAEPSIALVWSNSFKQALVYLTKEAKTASTPSQFRLTLYPPALALPDLPLFLLFGFYLALLEWPSQPGA